LVPCHQRGEPGNAQASLVEARQAVTIDRRDRRIDQDGERQLVPLACRQLIHVHLAPALWAVLQDRELQRHANLGCGKADARRGLHGRPHLRDQPSQLGGAQVGGVDGLGGAPQHRVTALHDRQHILIGHGDQNSSTSRPLVPPASRNRCASMPAASTPATSMPGM
jgi:hypothetical protein